MKKMNKLVALGSALIIALSVVPLPQAASYAASPTASPEVSFPASYPAKALTKLTDAQISARVEALINTMTRDEKLSLLVQGSASSTANGAKGYGTGYIKGIPRLGVPVLRMWDGPKGVISNSVLETTSPVSELGLAASFSESLAYDYGKLTGSDNKASAGNVQLGVQLDNTRSPFFSRGRDSMGEDPYLTGILGTSLSQGVEDQNVMSTLKHLAAYSTMYHHPIAGAFFPGMPAAQDDSIIDVQTLHETYLSPYERIVKAGASSAIMTSFNKINGTPAADNGYILKDVLRNMWGFSGVTMTDWGASVDVGHQLISNGGDLEMGTARWHKAEDTAASPGYPPYSPATPAMDGLKTVIRNQELTWDDIEEADRHILTAYGKIGYLGLVRALPNGTAAIDPEPPASIELPELTGSARLEQLAKNDEIALDSAVKGAVLLKNDGALPIQSGEKVAVIGLTGLYTLTGHYAESSFGWLKSMTSPYENLSDILGTSKVDGYVGLDRVGHVLDESLLTVDESGTTPGVNRYVDYNEATPIVTDVLSNVELTTGSRTYKNSDTGTAVERGHTARLETWFTPDVTGEYELALQAFGGPVSGRIYMSSSDTTGRVIPYSSTSSTGFQDAGSGWPTAGVVRTDEGMNIPSTSAKVNLSAGTAYRIVVVVNGATTASKDAQVRLVGYKPGERDQIRQDAVDAAQNADYDKVVVFVHDMGAGNGSVDPMAQQRHTLDIAADQKALLTDVIAAAKSKGTEVVVVTNIGLPITMSWLDDVDAVLNMWLPGQQGGLATAQLLTGIANPSGKLPVTFPNSENDTQFGPIANSYTMPRAAEYEEGIYSGYRWYDSQNITPLFSFGHGLSYTDFVYSNLQTKSIGKDDDFIEVSFTVNNAGNIAGSEVAQVYLGKTTVPSGIQMAEKQLAGFVRVENLAPGESRNVTVKIDRLSLSYWDENAEVITRADGTKDQWVLAEGKRAVYVGGAKPDASASNVKSVTIDVKDTVASSVTVDPAIATIYVDEKVTLKANVAPSDTTNKTITWSSANPEVASVDPNSGVVTAHAAGTVTITATAADGSGKTGTCVVTVKDINKEIEELSKKLERTLKELDAAKVQGSDQQKIADLEKQIQELKSSLEKERTALKNLNAKNKKASLRSVKSSKKKQITVKWKKASSVNGYQIQYSLKKNFKSAKSITISKSTTISKTIKKLKSKKVYYVKVRPYTNIDGKKVYGQYSSVKKVRVK